MRILVTGGAGFIGSHIAAHFQQCAQVTVVDNLRTGDLKNLQGVQCQFVEGSVTDYKLMLRLCAQADLVFHLAGMVSVPESVANPAECVEINTLGTLNVLEASARGGVKKLCLSSSTAIYGDDPVMPKKETMPPRPMCPYASSKLDGEFYCDLYRRSRGLSTVCLRYFNVFGPRQSPAGAYAAVIPAMITRALRGEDLIIYGDGGQTRDFVYIDDVVAANVHLATSDSAHGVYNVACGEERSVLQVAQAILAGTSSASQICFLPPRPGEIRRSYANITRLRESGFVPRTSFEAGLATTIDFFRNNSRLC